MLLASRSVFIQSGKIAVCNRRCIFRNANLAFFSVEASCDAADWRAGVKNRTRRGSIQIPCQIAAFRVPPREMAGREPEDRVGGLGHHAPPLRDAGFNHRLQFPVKLEVEQKISVSPGIHRPADSDKAAGS
jgi:hypothetical protein